MPIISVFSAVYSTGDEIARRIADRLEYEYVAEELLEEAATEQDTSTEKLARAMGKRVLLNTVTHEQEKSIAYIKAALARRLVDDNFVYHGPATHLIPSNISHALKVGIVAEPQFRVARAVEQTGIEPEQAAQQIEKADADVAQWLEHLTGRGLWHASLYDIKIPVPATSLDDAVAMICATVSKDVVRPNAPSLRAARNFTLATRVDLALVNQGHYCCDVTARDGAVSVVINKNISSKGAFIRAIQVLRYEQAEEQIIAICHSVEGVKTVQTKPGQGYRRPARALLVDDEEIYVLTLSRRLAKRNVASDAVYNGKQALAAVKNEEFGVMVLDLKMPGIDGLEVLRRVKREQPHMEVIILTGHGSKEDERVAKALGAFAFLTKPIDVDVLAKTMKAASRAATGQDSGEKSETADAHETGDPGEPE